MNKRERNALFKRITTGKRLDITKIPDLTDDERNRLVIEIVRRRLPVVVELIPEDFDFRWLYACGYLYEKTRNGYNLLCTGEQNY